MSLMTDDIKAEVREFLGGLDKPVTVHVHPVEGDGASDAVKELWSDLHALNGKIEVALEARRPEPIGPETPEDLESAITTFSVDGADVGIRYLGFPGGHEFGPMLQALRDLSTGAAPELSAAARDYVASLTRPLHLEVFVTPT